MSSFCNQTAKFLATVAQSMPELSGDVMQGWIENPKSLKKFLLGLCPPVIEQVLLRKITSVVVSGAKKFVADKASLKEANVGYTGSNFDEFFLGKMEENVADATLAIYRLEKNSLDAPIRKELGEHEETALTHFLDLLKKQAKGQEGHLLVNGYANIAYIRDKNGKLWTVNAYWRLLRPLLGRQCLFG